MTFELNEIASFSVPLLQYTVCIFSYEFKDIRIVKEVGDLIENCIFCKF